MFSPTKLDNRHLHSFRLFFLLIALCSSDIIYGQHPWEVQRLSFTASKSYENPYTLIPVSGEGDLLTVTFTGMDGEATGKKIVLNGCWNGEKEWIVNFSAPTPGTWHYTTRSSDRGLNNKKGKITVSPWSKEQLAVNPTRRGLLQVRTQQPGAGHYFQYSDGTPFLWIGDTWWNWTKPQIKFETYQQLVDNRAEKGFNVGQLFVPGNGWSSDNSALDSTYSILNPEQVKRVERMIQYANEKGITVWIHGWWSRENLNELIGEEKLVRWWRYLVHRFAAYNVIWVLAGEYNMHDNAGFPLSFWDSLGSQIDAEDPYERIISTHNTPPFWGGGAAAPQWSTGTVFHDAEWLDYHQSQVGHGRYANEMIPLIVKEDYERSTPKPVVVTEPWYEFEEGNAPAMDVRYAAWSAILSGAAGHTYGGGHVWPAHVPESPTDAGPWPLEKGFARTTYDYPGANAMGILAKFFEEIEWWTMKPHPELVSEYPQPFCLSRPGEEYIVYLRYGGYLKLDLQTDTEKMFSYYWFNPATGAKLETKRIRASGWYSFVCPRMYPAELEYSDWVLYLVISDK